jgi:cytochrome c553
LRVKNVEIPAIVSLADTKATKGSKLYAGCIACHGAKGEGGIGPSFVGSKSDYIASSLNEYKNKIERGPSKRINVRSSSSIIRQ